MTNSLDNILSGREAAPEASQEVEKEVTQAEPSVEGESQVAEQQTEGDEAGEQQGQRMVPQAALHAEKQKVKRYTEEVADFRKQLADSNAAWERRMAQLVEAVKPKQEAQAAPDFYEDPVAASRHAVSPQFEQFNQVILANAKLVAETKYGDEAVGTAEQAFIDALQSQKLDPADYHKVVNSPNRYAAAVQWHKRQQAQAEIGDDPAAFRAKVEAELKAKYGITEDGQQAQQPAKPAPVLPSNLAGARSVGARSGPAWSGPATLNDIFNRSRPTQ